MNETVPYIDQAAAMLALSFAGTVIYNNDGSPFSEEL